MGPKEVIQFAKKNGAVMVDLKFMDFPGMWQHFSVPLHELEEDSFEAGFGFDGSSIRGWQPIHASDMLVVPDPDTAVMDPFMEHPTLSLDLQHRGSCDKGTLHQRSAQYCSKGGSLPQIHQTRRHLLFWTRGGIFHLR